MSLRLFALRLWQNGRQFIKRNHFSYSHWTEIKTEKIIGKASESRGSVSVVSPLQSHINAARRVFADNILRRVTNSLSGELRKKTTRQLLFGNSTPFFALIGVSLASGTGIITKEDELDGICWEIREAVERMHESISAAQSDLFKEGEEINLNRFIVGPPLAKGCHAVVYAAAKKNEDPVAVTTTEDAVATDGSNEVPEARNGLGQQHLLQSQIASNQGPTLTVSLDKPIASFPFALKALFNYDIESNALSLLKGMYREMLPARNRVGQYQLLEGNFGDVPLTRLEPHPNIVQMHCVFTDYVVEMPGAMTICPSALPPRVNAESGLARNMSLFLVMKRYDRTLKDHIAKSEISIREATLLLTQLLEGIAFLNSRGVAHRDLKSDNILLEVTADGECPILVITDFGCCLTGGLSLPFRTIDTDRGGNPALMAPEVVMAKPGLFSTINYSKSDCWSAGAIAYEMFLGRNPFYPSGPERKRLMSATYRVEDLPDLSKELGGLPKIVSATVEAIMSRSPSRRLSAEEAATILQIHLWSPTAWKKVYPVPSNSEVMQWLLSLSTKVLCCLCGLEKSRRYQRRTDAEYLLIGSFLRRVNLLGIRRALKFLHMVEG